MHENFGPNLFTENCFLSIVFPKFIQNATLNTIEYNKKNVQNEMVE